MKKHIALLIASVLIFGVSTTAFAQQPVGDAVTDATADIMEEITDIPEVAEEQGTLSPDPERTLPDAEPEPVELEATEQAVATATDFTYRVHDSKRTAAVTGYRGTAKSITLPRQIDTYQVTEIDAYAFQNSAVEEVVIPDQVASIGYMAFANAPNLKKVTLPSGLMYISQRTFYRCRQLNNVKIPSGVLGIGDRAFEGCTSLSSIDIPDSVMEISAYAFAFCTSMERAKLPANTVTFDGAGIFSYCYNLKEVVFPKKLTNIPSDTFYGCDSMQSVKLPTTLQEVGNNSFQRCYGLKSVSLPASVKTIGASAFSDCDTLADVVIQGQVKRIESSTFKMCSNLKAITIPQSVTSIADDAFFGAYNKLTVRGTAGSYAETFARKNGYTFVPSGPLTKPAQPTAVKATAYSGGKIRVYWKENTAVTGYYLYRATSRTGTYKCVRRVYGVRAITDKSLKSGTTYYYKVVPYNGSDSKKLKGPSSAVVYATAKA